MRAPRTLPLLRRVLIPGPATVLAVLVGAGLAVAVLMVCSGGRT